MAYTPENNPYIPGDPYSYDLKWIVDQIKSWAGRFDNAEAAIIALNEDFDDLKAYVNSYFDDLDIQTEINQKLDEMASDGTLASVIASTVLKSASPVFVNSISDMTDPERFYVLLPGGYIYTYSGSAFVNTGINYITDYQKYIPTSGTVNDTTDLDTLLVNGVWNISGANTYVNCPITTGCLLVFENDGAVFQYATEATSLNKQIYGRTFFRSYISNTWSDWRILNTPFSYADRYAPELGSFRIENNTIFIDAFETGYYMNQTGALANDSTAFSRSKSLIPVKGGMGIWAVTTESSANIYAVYFNDTYSYLGYDNIKQKASTPAVTPLNCAYIGISVQLDIDTITPIEIKLIDSTGLACVYPDLDSDKIYNILSRVINPSTGALSAESTSFRCFYIPNPKFKYMCYTGSLQQQCFCLGWDGAIHSPAAFTDLKTARLYEIPEGTKILGVNVYAPTHQNADSVSFYYEEDIDDIIISDSIPVPYIMNKRIAAVGDSLTWYDSQTQGAVRVRGWQNALRKYGAIVTTYGYNGKAMAENSESDAIVDLAESAVDFANTDILILFAGSNDERLDIALGTPNASYSSPNTTKTTVIGAFGHFINYARGINPNIIIFICKIMPSSSSDRPYSEWTSYNEAIEELCSYWSVPVIPTDTFIPAKPGSGNWSTFYYDTVHPNNAGFKKLGEGICNFVNNFYMQI